MDSVMVDSLWAAIEQVRDAKLDKYAFLGVMSFYNIAMILYALLKKDKQ